MKVGTGDFEVKDDTSFANSYKEFGQLLQKCLLILVVSGTKVLRLRILRKF